MEACAEGTTRTKATPAVCESSLSLSLSLNVRTGTTPSTHNDNPPERLQRPLCISRALMKTGSVRGCHGERSRLADRDRAARFQVRHIDRTGSVFWHTVSAGVEDGDHSLVFLACLPSVCAFLASSLAGFTRLTAGFSGFVTVSECIADPEPLPSMERGKPNVGEKPNGGGGLGRPLSVSRLALYFSWKKTFAHTLVHRTGLPTALGAHLFRSDPGTL